MSEPLQQMTFWPDAVGSTSLPEACRVSLRRLPGSDRVPRIPAGSGPSTCDSSWISDLSGYLRRTCQAFYPSGNPSRCSLTWKRRATKSGRLLWALGRSEPRTSGIGRGSSADAWTSPTCRDAESLAKVTRGAGSAAKGNQIIEPLAVQAQNWPTCGARDYRSPNLRPYAERGGKTKGEQLPNFLRHWNTLSAQDCEQAGSAARGGLTNDARVSAGPPVPARTSTSGKHRDLRTPTDENRGVHPHPDSKAGQHSLTTQAKGQLNPAWVLQLQGLPDGWLDLPDATLSRLSATRTRRGCRSSSGGG